MILKRGDRVLLYLPYAGIIERARLELLLAQTLSRQGIEVDLLRCRGILPGPCAVKNSIHGDEKPLGRFIESITCTECRRAGRRIAEVSEVNEIYLEDLLDEESRSSIRKLAVSVTQPTWQNFEVNGIPIGRYAAYLPLIRAQAVSPNDLISVWNRYVLELEACLLVANGVSTILAERTYSLAMTTNGLYGPDRTFHKLASRAKVPIVVLEGSILAPELTSVLHGFSSDEKYFQVIRSPKWKSIRNQPLTHRAARRATRHHLLLTEGSSPLVYSSKRRRSVRAADVLAKLEIPSDSKILLFTVSSPDEDVAREYSTDTLPRVDQDSFALQSLIIKQLMKYADSRPNVYLVIRLHPRLYGIGSGSPSPAIDFFVQLSTERRSNVRIDSPETSLSIYDLIQVADVGATFQSSTALEFLAFGLPVVVGSRQFLTCPHDLVAVATDDESLTEFIDQALTEEPSFKRAIEAFRWWGFVSRYNRLLEWSHQLDREAEVSQTNGSTSHLAPKGLRVIENQTRLQSWSTKLPRKLVVITYLITSRFRFRQRSQDVPNVVEILSCIASGNDYLSSEEAMTEEEEELFLRKHLLERFNYLGYDKDSDYKVSRLYRELARPTSDGMSQSK